MSIKLVDCKYCGRPNLAWAKSARTGRFYLAHVNATRSGASYGHSTNATWEGGYYIEKHRPHTREECDKGKGTSPELWNEMRLMSEGTFR